MQTELPNSVSKEQYSLDVLSKIGRPNALQIWINYFTFEKRNNMKEQAGKIF